MPHKNQTHINREIMPMRNDGTRRRLRINNTERRELNRNLLYERVVSMFLDLEHNWTREEMCQELQITHKRLKDITLADEFQEIYAQYRTDLGHDPRLQATQIAISDMMPQAVRALQDLISGERTPASTKLEAAKTILKLGGLTEPKPVKTEKAEVMDFLREAGINIENLNVQLPAELQRANQFITVMPRELPPAKEDDLIEEDLVEE